MGTNSESIRIKIGNISEENKSFVWFLPKTGTNHAVGIFRRFGFYSYGQYVDGVTKKELNANHWTYHFEGHEKYRFICTARNPFTRILSLYKFNVKDSSDWNPENFKTYFWENFKPNLLKNFIINFDERKPDYVIRIESLYQDYIKIPFINDSEFNKSGELLKYCNIKVNSTQEIQNISEYYTDDMINLVLEYGKNHFETLGYNNFLN